MALYRIKLWDALNSYPFLQVVKAEHPFKMPGFAVNSTGMRFEYYDFLSDENLYNSFVDFFPGQYYLLEYTANDSRSELIDVDKDVYSVYALDNLYRWTEVPLSYKEFQSNFAIVPRPAYEVLLDIDSTAGIVNGLAAEIPPNFKLVIPNKGATIIGDDAFIKEDHLVQVRLPVWSEIGDKAFASCTNLKTVDFNAAVSGSKIGRRAFSFCVNLEKVVLPDGVSSVGAYAFQDCKSLTELYLPDSIQEIDNFAFLRCSNLNKVVYGGTEQQFRDIKKSVSWDVETPFRYVECSDGRIDVTM